MIVVRKPSISILPGSWLVVSKHLGEYSADEFWSCFQLPQSTYKKVQAKRRHKNRNHPETGAIGTWNVTFWEAADRPLTPLNGELIWKGHFTQIGYFGFGQKRFMLPYPGLSTFLSSEELAHSSSLKGQSAPKCYFGYRSRLVYTCPALGTILHLGYVSCGIFLR